MKKLGLIALLLASTVVMAGSYTCQLDNMDMYFTGRTQVQYGHLLYEYRCPVGHTAWVVQ